MFICRYNTSINQGDLAKALPFGLSYGMICSQVGKIKSSALDKITLHILQGIYNGEHFSGACRGDDGGPLTVEVD